MGVSRKTLCDRRNCPVGHGNDEAITVQSQFFERSSPRVHTFQVSHGAGMIARSDEYFKPCGQQSGQCLADTTCADDS